MPENRNVPSGAPLLNVVLLKPEIPQNTGNIGRLCAYTGTKLHLIHPLGFQLSDKYLRRSGMDYWQHVSRVEYPDWQAYLDERKPPVHHWMFTTRATHTHWEADFRPGDYLLFGNEGSGCPDTVHQLFPPERKLKIPQLVQGQRSLNLSTSVGIVVYEALKKIKEFANFTVY